jgi:Iap family predicted aminopeptidase
MKNNNVIQLSEEQFKRLINESVESILKEKRYPKWNALSSPYDDTKEFNGATQPLRDDVNMQFVRARVTQLIAALNKGDIEVAKKRAMRLLKLVDAMHNQGF